MTTEYSISEMLSFYEETMRELTKSVTVKSKAKRLAKKELHRKYPENIIFSNEHTSDRGRLIGGMSSISHKYYPDVKTPKAAKPAQYRFEAPEVKNEETTNCKKKPFNHIMLELAAIGFIPSLEVFKVFMNGETPKIKSFTAAISNLKKSNYLCKKNNFGYEVILIAPKETA